MGIEGKNVGIGDAHAIKRTLGAAMKAAECPTRADVLKYRGQCAQTALLRDTLGNSFIEAERGLIHKHQNGKVGSLQTLNLPAGDLGNVESHRGERRRVRKKGAVPIEEVSRERNGAFDLTFNSDGRREHRPLYRFFENGKARRVGGRQTSGAVVQGLNHSVDATGLHLVSVSARAGFDKIGEYAQTLTDYRLAFR